MKLKKRLIKFLIPQLFFSIPFKVKFLLVYVSLSSFYFIVLNLFWGHCPFWFKAFRMGINVNEGEEDIEEDIQERLESWICH